MGADIEEWAVEGAGATADGGAGEPVADLTVRSSDLRAIDLASADVAAAIDEIPILCLAASQATGHDRHSRRRRAAAQGIGSHRRHAEGLRALGARIDVDGDDLTIHGRAAPRSAPQPTASTTTGSR